ncbi:hypothetical protein MTR67_044292 [Solanum verrucosum]|uniref:Uncharacterized protein n=1 Tax=Solanum verrucosum TaxID=315347 RepID=A0AAF0URB3_SOLVR|nr:hypothetical protein MTR67_044292 [Solanum verrucosum]
MTAISCIYFLLISKTVSDLFSAVGTECVMLCFHKSSSSRNWLPPRCQVGILRDLSKVSTTGAQEHSVKSSEQNNGEADGSDVMAAAGIITSDDENMVLPSE